MAEDDFGAHDDYQRELDEEAEFEQQRADAERRNAAENVAGITVLQEGTHLFGLAMDVYMCDFGALCYVHVCVQHDERIVIATRWHMRSDLLAG